MNFFSPRARPPWLLIACPTDRSQSASPSAATATGLLGWHRHTSLAPSLSSPPRSYHPLWPRRHAQPPGAIQYFITGDLEDDPYEDEDPVLKTAVRILGEAQESLGPGNANLSSIRFIIEVLLTHKALHDPADDLVDSRIQQSHYPCESSEVGVYTVANQITLTADEILFKLLGAILPDHIDMTLPDVTCMVEERIMLMRYYSPHPDGVGLWWTQEWWTF